MEERLSDEIRLLTIDEYKTEKPKSVSKSNQVRSAKSSCAGCKDHCHRRKEELELLNSFLIVYTKALTAWAALAVH